MKNELELAKEFVNGKADLVPSKVIELMAILIDEVEQCHEYMESTVTVINDSLGVWWPVGNDHLKKDSLRAARSDLQYFLLDDQGRKDWNQKALGIGMIKKAG